jgi:putative ATP-binding cassette transporter
MKLLYFLNTETKAPKERLLLIAGVSGLCSGLLVIFINAAADQASNHTVAIHLLVAYILAFIIYLWGIKYALTQAHIAVESALQTIKLRITDKVRQVELRFLEEEGGMDTFSPLVQDTNLIAQGVVLLIFSIQSLFMIIITAVYLASISPVGFILTGVVLVLLMPMIVKNYHLAVAEMQTAAKKEGEFFNLFTDTLHGFKELKLDQRESDGLFADLKQLNKEAQQPKHRANDLMIHDVLFYSGIGYLLLLVVVFILPSFLPEHSSTIHKLTATVLFIIGPLTIFASTIPTLARVDSSVTNLYRLEERLDAANKPFLDELLLGGEPMTDFKRLQMRNVLFHYHTPNGQILFTSGPFNLEIRQGELIFIVGGNGSGKSTFLKLLTGLYRPISGDIEIDDELVDDIGYPTYRELFSIVFTDFHLFDRLYGLPNLQATEVNAWLRRMRLDEKTRYRDGKFTNIDLSTGQKKRLAFIVAVLRKRPIYIFDEVAADQDPDFRQHFYEQILPSLSSQGATLIVVSHDDKYFHCADRIIKLQDGKIISDKLRQEEI